MLRKILYIILLLILVSWLGLQLRQPSNNRNWNDDQELLPTATFDDDLVSIKNIRNFEYRSTTDYTPKYYDKTFDLNKISSVDYIVEPFGGIGAAHTFLSFGFDDKEYIAISVEIRKEKGEAFSATKGLLRSYELMYVIADERDVINLRANYRKDPVYLYPIQTSPEKIRELFIDMLNRANKLVEEPEFYNTLTNTCTTNLASHANKITPKRIPWDLRLLFPKNSDKLAYEIGLIDNSVTLEEAREKYLINKQAEKYKDNPGFSIKIREDISK